MQSLRFNIVDVFTEKPLEGNQLAVFTNAAGLSDERMQSLAREMGFSESTFLFPPTEGGHARVRIFTPEEELPFAGHPVLGTAFVLAMPLQLTLVKLETGKGIVPVLLQREGAKIVFGVMSQPIPTIEPFPQAEELLTALGVGASGLPVELYDNGSRHVYVEMPDEASVAGLQPDHRALTAVAGDAGVNCFSADGVRVKTRMFGAGMGVGEDAATGSAAGPLAVHLARHGRIGWGDEITISQGAEIGRPSTLRARAEGGPEGVTQVEVGGSAVVVGKGEFGI